MKENIKKMYFELNELIGVSGTEHDVAKYCKEQIMQYADNVEVMKCGNVIAHFDSGKPGYKVMICAHMDEVGYIVKYIDNKGFIRFERVGNVVVKTLPSRRVIIKGDNGYIVGVVGSIPGHVETSQEASTVAQSKDLFIDIGAKSREEVINLGIDIGSVAVPYSPAMELANKDLVIGRAVDDRLGCAVLLELGRILKKEEFEGSVDLVFSVQEETAMLGAAIASKYINPDYCIVLDTFPAGDVPNVSDERLAVKLGGGPVMSCFDMVNSAAIGYSQNKKLIQMVRKISNEKSLPYQMITMCEANYATDAMRIKLIGNNAECIALGLPRRYSHSPEEIFDVNDSVNMLKLINEMIKRQCELDLSFL